jgi:hypothetical protein
MRNGIELALSTAQADLARQVLAALKDKWILIPHRNTVKTPKRKAEIEHYRDFNRAFREVERDVIALFTKLSIDVSDEVRE